MEGESNTETVKIDIDENGTVKTKSTIQDGERERPLEGDSGAKSKIEQVKGGNYYVNDEEITNTAKIDINGNGQDKTKRTVQDGDRECLPESKTEAESWIGQLKRRFESTQYRGRKSSPHVSIYRVPESIKRTKPEAYDPLVVFLGPFHHNKHQQLTVADDYKLQAVGRTLERLQGMTIEDLVENVRQLEKEIRDCYEDSVIGCDGDALAWIMTMDACFILEFLRMDLPNSSLIFQSNRESNVKIQEIVSDILKLENQIPLFILERILKLELMSEDSTAVPETLLAKHLRCISWYFQGYPFSLRGDDDEFVSRLSGLIKKWAPHHLLDLSRRVITDFLSNSGSESADCCSCSVQCSASSCIATSNGNGCFRAANSTEVSSTVQESFIPSAEKLKTAGIKLKASTEGKLDFKRKRFRRSTFIVPQIIVADETEIFLRNLVAVEACLMREEISNNQIISSNMWIMDQLIDSKEDVQLLQRAEIIINYIGTEDKVAKIFNDLCFGITITDNFEDVSKNVSKHFKGWEKMKDSTKEFQENHCTNTWYIVSFVAAAVIFTMSLLQTIYTMESYYHS